MKKLVLYIAASLDGYIATPDHSVNWLEELDNPDGNDYGYMAFLEGIDTLIMGRKTYEVVTSFDMEWPYKQCKTFVLTSKEDLETNTPDTQVLSGDPASFIKELKTAPGDKAIWLLGGGQTIAFLLEHQAIDEIMLFTAPIILGKGVPLLPELDTSTKLKLLANRSYPSGMVYSQYLVEYT